MYIVFDTETTGKPINYKAPMHDVNNWPRVAQLAWACYGADKQLITAESHLILPDGWVIPKEQFFIENGMSTERNMAEGVPIRTVLDRFISQYNECDFLIAHNFTFDYNIVGAEMIRQQVRANKKLKGICTMETTTQLCKLPHLRKPGQKWTAKGYKWPTLQELYAFLFKETLVDAHDALGDVMSTANCFFKLLEMGVITL